MDSNGLLNIYEQILSRKFKIWHFFESKYLAFNWSVPYDL